jgi:YD repeat-containing protein
MTEDVLKPSATTAPVPYGHHSPVLDLQTASGSACTRPSETPIINAGQLVIPPQRAGQPLETTTLGYSASGYVTSITLTNLGYDGPGRLRTVTASDGHVTTTDYDALNRTTPLSYPNGTYEQIGWNRLDPEWTRDREGR